MSVDVERIPCPYCSEQIATTAVKCRYCGEWLNSDAIRTDGDATVPQQKPHASSAQTPKQSTDLPNEFRGYRGPGASQGRSGRLLKKELWQLRPDELVITRSQPYFTRYYVIMFASSVLLIFPALIAATVWITVRLRRPEWILTDRRVITVVGWLTRNAQSIALDKVNEVLYRRTFWERTLWGQGTIVIESAATLGLTFLRPVADDDPFRHALEAAVTNSKKRS